MEKTELAIFDFDGTLADSLPFFLTVFNRLAEQHGFDSIDLDNACAFRGYSARQMMEHVGMPLWKLPLVAKSFLALMKESSHRVFMFDGVSDMLRHLHAHGVTLAVVTSNSRDNVSSILGKENMPLISHLETGASIFGKAPRIARVLGRSKAAHDRTIYIGDQASDLDAAHKAGVAFGAISWGYATIDSLLAHRPDHVFQSVSDLKRLAGTGSQAEMHSAQ
ncbi:MAG: HAD hydrolase-like protein [Burkholderiaceae bacterium]